jgi:hypothetical protein
MKDCFNRSLMLPARNLQTRAISAAEWIERAAYIFVGEFGFSQIRILVGAVAFVMAVALSMSGQLVG